MSYSNLQFNLAKVGKNDEFYTQYEDIKLEMESYLACDPNVFKGKVILLPCDDPEWSNFTKYFITHFKLLGLEKLISTCYNSEPNGKGKLLIVDKQKNGKNNFQDLKPTLLEGNGDFNSLEIKKFRDEADIIITNPPFSLFRKFLTWIVEADKKFSIIGNMNAITSKDVFPLFKENKMWLGASIHGGDREFRVPKDYPLNASNYRSDEYGNYIRVKGVRWFTNLEHNFRHNHLSLMNMNDNLKFNRRLKNTTNTYREYDNYHAIEVPITSAIPSDYEGVMGVPISFLDKYNPDQFEILGMDFEVKDNLSHLQKGIEKNKRRAHIDGKCLYSRILIKRKKCLNFK